MRRSTTGTLVTHAGTDPQPTNMPLPAAVAEVVKKQVEAGIDIVNDGELSKSNFTNYARDRLGGIAPANSTAGELPPRNINARDLREFPQFFASGGGGFGRNRPGVTAPAPRPAAMVVTGPITYIRDAPVLADIAPLKGSLAECDAGVDAFLPSAVPGT